MADDIVARLRAHVVRRDMTARSHWDGCIDSHPLCALAWALDEIERLRATGDALYAAIRNHDLTEANLKVWEEARRG